MTRQRNKSAEPLGYSSYLQLPRLLDSQAPVSDVPDEYMFIVAHQASELWLATLIRQLEQARVQFTSADLKNASVSISVCVEIVSAMSSVWPVLGTISVENFNTLREKLGSASGLRSIQFRILEVILGIADAKHEALFAAGSNERKMYQEAQRRGPLMAVVEVAVVDGNGVDAWRDVLQESNNSRLEYAVAQQLLALSHSVQEWRRQHVAIVARLIGGAKGTGGTSGEVYLSKMLEKRVFPELVDASRSPLEGEICVEA